MMGYSIGWDSDNNRWKGYGVPCVCEHPDCSAEIDRGMGYLCEGCGLSYCGKHWGLGQCERCWEIDDVGDRPEGLEPFPAKPEHPGWLQHLRTDPSWSEWRSKSGNMAQLDRWEKETYAR